MGFLDNLKAKLAPAKDKVGDLAQQHGGKIEQGLDRAARTVDQKTKGKYSDKIGTGTRKAKDAVDRLGHRDGGTTPPPPPASPGGTPPPPGNTPPPPPSH
ncbi:antitoxin [Streptomyces sp. NPDC088729]|uniref:antitoxin n=1 Tax=Streptomyces sp. NPDC088729 TaxID=3365876 RepID=UPI003807CE9F